MSQQASEKSHVTAQRYASPTARARLANYLCPECGYPPSSHSSNSRFCDLTRVGVQERIAQYERDVASPPASEVRDV